MLHTELGVRQGRKTDSLGDKRSWAARRRKGARKERERNTRTTRSVETDEENELYSKKKLKLKLKLKLREGEREKVRVEVVEGQSGTTLEIYYGKQYIFYYTNTNKSQELIQTTNKLLVQ